MAYRVSKRVQGKALTPKLKPSVQNTRPVKEPTKPQITVSTSNILRRKPVKEVYGKRHSQRSRLPVPQHDLFLDYQDQVEASRSELLNSSLAGLNQTHTDVTESLAKLHMRNTEFYDDIERKRKRIFAPILEETVETAFTRDGKSVSEVAQIGQRIEAFKSLLAKKESELANCWAQWEKVQTKIVELGIDVFGSEALSGGGNAGNQRETRGYRRDMEELDAEHQVWLREVEEEIQLLGQEALGEMALAEKEFNATLKKEQANLIARVFADND